MYVDTKGLKIIMRTEEQDDTVNDEESNSGQEKTNMRGIARVGYRARLALFRNAHS